MLQCTQCSKEREIEAMKIDIAVAKSDISTVKNDIIGIKDTLNKMNWYVIGIMGTTILTLVTLIVKK
jgi:hypothetical protein